MPPEFSLNESPSQASVSLTSLIQSLRHIEVEAKREAVLALSRLGRNLEIRDEADISAIIASIRDSDIEVRQYTIRLLVQIQPVTQQITELLIEALKDESTQVCISASLALREIENVDLYPFLPVLINAMQDRDADVRTNIVSVLGRIRVESDSTEANAIATALNEAMQDECKGVRVNAASALGTTHLANATSVKLLIKGLSDEASGVRWNSAITLGKLKPSNLATVNALVAALGSHDNDLCLAAISALANIGSLARTAIPAFTQILNTSNPRIRHHASMALRKIAE
jgi:HEAT repeat protein